MERFLKKSHLLYISWLTLITLQVSAAPNEQAYVEGEMIIKFKSDVDQNEEDVLKRLSEQVAFDQFAKKLETKAKVEIIKKFEWAKLYHVRVGTWESLDKKMEEIQALPEVEFVEPNYILSLGSSVEARDYQLDTESPESQKTNPSLDMNRVLASCGSMTVAVIDTGADYTHPDLVSNIWRNEKEIPGNGIDDDGNGYTDDVIGWDFVNGDNDPYDDHYHGTHVAGIILSRQDNQHPVIKIMPLKFLNAKGLGSTGDAIRAIDYAIKNGARVLNNSWGGGSYSQALRDAIIASYYHNNLFVVAAGNNSDDIDQRPFYPSSYTVPNMVSVAALTDAKELAWFSNFGPYTVHVGAPGISVRSAVPKERCAAPPCYAYLSGTSMATPYVSGVAAMMFCENQDLMHLQVKNIIIETSVSNAALQGKIGKGSVSDNDAFYVASSTTPDTGAIPPYTPSSIPDAIGLKSGVGLASSPMGCGLVKDISRGGNDTFSSQNAVSLFFWMWPLLFIGLWRSFGKMRRKMLLCEV